MNFLIKSSASRHLGGGVEEELHMFSRKINTDKVLATVCPVIVRMHIFSLECRAPSDGVLLVLKNDNH